MTVTADDLSIACVDFMLTLVHDAADERKPIEYLNNRLLEMRSALTGTK